MDHRQGSIDPDAMHDALAALLSGERDWLANLANAAALIGRTLPGINWAGFYLLRGGELVLGPFWGAPACVRIAKGRGVCGAAAERRSTVVVPDVHAFPGHIACDPASRSEIVVPLLSCGRLLGVLDLDAPTIGRFADPERALLERLATIITTASDWPSWIGESAG